MIITRPAAEGFRSAVLPWLSPQTGLEVLVLRFIPAFKCLGTSACDGSVACCSPWEVKWRDWIGNSVRVQLSSDFVTDRTGIELCRLLEPSSKRAVTAQKRVYHSLMRPRQPNWRLNTGKELSQHLPICLDTVVLLQIMLCTGVSLYVVHI
jgi:hypothetical protein